MEKITLQSPSRVSSLVWVAFIVLNGPGGMRHLGLVVLSIGGVARMTSVTVRMK
jgi:hypothetical protein